MWLPARSHRESKNDREIRPLYKIRQGPSAHYTELYRARNSTLPLALNCKTENHKICEFDAKLTAGAHNAWAQSEKSQHICPLSVTYGKRWNLWQRLQILEGWQLMNVFENNTTRAKDEEVRSVVTWSAWSRRRNCFFGVQLPAVRLPQQWS